MPNKWRTIIKLNNVPSRTADGCHIYELGSSETFVRLLLHCKMSDHV